jgi:hypothetical protein
LTNAPRLLKSDITAASGTALNAPEPAFRPLLATGAYVPICAC